MPDLQPAQFSTPENSAWHGVSEQRIGPNMITRHGAGVFGRRTVEAIHPNSGKRVGYLNWFSPLGDKPAEVYKTYVSGPQRRKGVATAMFNHARQVEPGLQHSTALTDDGKAWAKARP